MDERGAVLEEMAVVYPKWAVDRFASCFMFGNSSPD